MDNRIYFVTIDGLIRDDQNKLLLLKEPKQTWDLPGGRLEHGETFRECFAREAQEELGVGGELTKDQPTYIWTAKDVKDRWRLILCFEAKLDSLNFKKTEEHIDHAFLTKEEISQLELRPQARAILNFL